MVSFDDLLADLEAEAGINDEPTAPGDQQSSNRSAADDFLFGRTGGSSAFDKLTELTSWAGILEPAGWQRVPAPDAATAEAWKRPGGTHPVNGNVLKAAPWALVVWSEDSGLPVGRDQKLTKARVIADLHYNGDESALAKDLVRGRA